MRRDEDGTASFDGVRALRETDMALLCVVDGEETWVPKSQIHDDSEVFDADGNSEGRLVVTEWFARQRGLV